MFEITQNEINELQQIISKLTLKDPLEKALLKDAQAGIWQQGMSGKIQEELYKQYCVRLELQQALSLLTKMFSKFLNEATDKDLPNIRKMSRRQTSLRHKKSTNKDMLEKYASSLLLGLPTYPSAEGTSSNNSNRYTLYSSEVKPFTGSEPIVHGNEGHLMTIAPTGAGKGRSVIIPNLLTYRGQVVTIDPKGENYTVTARARREMGHQVIKLDPFRVIDEESDCLNPLDIFELDNADIETDAEMLAESLATGKASLKEPFWDLSARGLYSGLIAHVATMYPDSERNINSVRKLLINEDVILNLAKILDNKGDCMNRMAYDEIAAFLMMPEQNTRPSVLATAAGYIKTLTSDRVSSTLKNSSFSLEDIVTGKPVSIYIIIPPSKLKSHRVLLRLWIGTLFQAITSRKKIPQLPMLMLLDECAQLGNFSYLETLITLCRGYGVKVWSFWQDLSQLQQLYPSSWMSLVNNSAVLQFFGAKNHSMSQELGTLIGVNPEAIRDLPPDEQILVVNGNYPVQAKKFDYLKQKQFKDLFESNPFYEEQKNVTTRYPSGL